jgi:uncharacterized protein (TIGR00251 family)
MKFIEKVESTVYLLKIFVKPNSKKQMVSLNSVDDEYLTIFLRSKPIQNKANRELLSFLKKKLRNNIISVELVSGTKSSNKLVRIIIKDVISEQKISNLLTN